MALIDQTTALPCTALGADAGGSKVHILMQDATGIREREMPSVNLRRVSVDEAADKLAEAITQALDGQPLAADAVCCLGAAGAGTDAVATPLRESLSHELGLPTGQIIVTSDAQIAHRAAFGTDAGILIIAGTGSGCYAVSEEGFLLRAGGWGPGLEDPGSGSELGREAVKHLLSDLERGSMSRLSTAISEHLGLARPTIPAVLDAFYQPDFSAAQLAPVVLDALEAGDGHAATLVEHQVSALARQAGRLAATMSPAPRGIALVGGLMTRDSYVEQLVQALSQSLPHLTASRATRTPAEGALEWAATEQRRLSP